MLTLGIARSAAMQAMIDSVRAPAAKAVMARDPAPPAPATPAAAAKGLWKRLTAVRPAYLLGAAAGLSALLVVSSSLSKLRRPALSGARRQRRRK